MTPFMKRCDDLAEPVFDLESSTDMKWMTLEWMTDRFVARMLKGFEDRILCCHKGLSGYDEKSKFEYNDLDCHAWQVPWLNDEYGREYAALSHTSQNRNVLFVVRLPWQQDPESIFSAQAVSIYEFKSYERPDLPMLNKIVEGRGSKYGDARDPEWVISNEGIAGRVEHALGNIYRIRWALFDIETLECALGE